MAFRIASAGAMKEAFLNAKPSILEPIMKVEVTVPHEFQGVGIALINKRKGQLTGSETQDMAVVIEAEVPLAQMFGFSTDIRSATQVCRSRVWRQDMYLDGRGRRAGARSSSVSHPSARDIPHTPRRAKASTRWSTFATQPCQEMCAVSC